jgi:hypothetical protein
MNLSEADLQELYRRAQLALNSGYTVARGEAYAALLGGSDGSPAALVELCEAAIGEASPDDAENAPSTDGSAKADAEKGHPKAAKADAEKDHPKAAPAPPVEAVESGWAVDGPAEDATAAADEGASEDVASEAGPEYEGWSRKQLLAEADAKGLEVKGNMSKADIITALRSATS